MIQRVQTIFLAIAAIAIFSLIFFPIWEKVNTASTEVISLNSMTLTYSEAGKVKKEANTIYITVLAFLSAAVSIGSIMSFKNRMTQIKLNFLNALLLLVTVGLIAFNMYTVQQAIDPENTGNFQIGFFLPMIALLCNSLANRFIRKDEKLVRSVDRLR